MKSIRRPDKTNVASHRATCLWIYCALLVFCLTAVSDAHQLSAYDVKAAYVYNFAKFVDWPVDVFPDDSSPVRIGIFGNTDFADVLKETVKGKTAYGRQLEIIAVTDDTQMAELHILYFTHETDDRYAELLDTLQGQSLLTIGECDRFAVAGGIINLFTEDNKVRFEINPAAARRAGLTISSHLLKLARIVPDSSSEEGR